MVLIVFHDEPFEIVEDNLFRSFSKYNTHFSRKTFKEVLYLVLKIVESKISMEMKQTSGAIIYDGWTASTQTHDVDLFVSYIHASTRTVAGRSLQYCEDKCPLISLSPIMMKCKCYKSISICTTEAVSFDTKVHATHIHEIFDLFGTDFKQWTLAQIADNCNLNKKIRILLRIPHVGCVSHRINKEVERMIAKYTSLRECIASVCNTMNDCRSGLKNRAVLRNITSLSPVLDNRRR